MPLALSVLLQVAIFGFCVACCGHGAPTAAARDQRGLPRHAGRGPGAELLFQPHDPQMQVNVMVWLTVAFALLLMAVTRRFFIVLAVLSAVPLVHNVATFARWRGGDAEAIAALRTIEQRLVPERTVFVYWGFEPITMWHYALWSRTWDWDGAPNDARFKWIALNAGAIRHASWTPEQNAQSIRRDLDGAFARGYRVVMSDAWTWSVETLAGELAALSAANRARRSTPCCTTISPPGRCSTCRASASTTSSAAQALTAAPGSPAAPRGPFGGGDSLPARNR
jgi:hypothetical protein